MDEELKEYSRPEEIISEVWGQICSIREKGVNPGKIILSLKHYRMIQDYHAVLGEAPEGIDDYIQKYSLFGIPFFIDDVRKIHVAEE